MPTTLIFAVLSLDTARNQDGDWEITDMRECRESSLSVLDTIMRGDVNVVRREDGERGWQVEDATTGRPLYRLV